MPKTPAKKRRATYPDRKKRALPPKLTADTPILIQGITGRTARLHTGLMLEYGSNIVAGVTPFKGGNEVEGVPVYDSVAQAVANHDIGASLVFVPPAFAPDATLEAAQAGVPWIVCITDGLSQLDMLHVKEQLRFTDSRLIGPNNPGIILPERTKIGIMPGEPFSRGPVALLSRSGTLTYEVAERLTSAGVGQSVCVGIGGDPFVGEDFIDFFELLANDDETKVVVVIGEVGGAAEEELADYIIRTGFKKPVGAFIAGRTAPPGKRLGHAGAILEEGGSVQAKIESLEEAGVVVCADLSSLALCVGRML